MLKIDEKRKMKPRRLLRFDFIQPSEA